VAAAEGHRDGVADLAGGHRHRARLRHPGPPQPGLGRPRLDRAAGADTVPGAHLPGGGGPARLVPPTRARLGPLAFSAGGKSLYYGSRQPDGARRLEVYSLSERRRLEPAWTGDRDLLAIVGRRDPAATQLAVDTGSGCGDRRADLSGLDGGPGRPLLPSASRPTSAVGWLDTRRVLVVEGGCDGPFDLWLVDVNGGEPKPVAHGIDRAALRFPDPRPPPAAPDLAALARG
jgi:hypothetical protein